MAYRCNQAIIGGAREPIQCKVSGSVCAHQKFCLMEGRIVLTDQSMKCPARDGQLLPDEPEKVPVTVPAEPAAEPETEAAPEAEPAKKTTRKKTASRKKE